MVNLILFLSLLLKAAPVKIAVVDTGLNLSLAKDIPLCGYYDLTNTGYQDTYGHGTNVSGIIHNFSKNRNYCQVIYKVFDRSTKNSYEPSLEAFKMISKDPDIKVINYSANGNVFFITEKIVIDKLIRQGKKFVTAAGNDSLNLDAACNSYPACYSKNIISVGNGQTAKDRAVSSNYGKRVSVWENGVRQCAYSICLTGTSQATAVHSGKLVREMASESLDHRLERQTQSTGDYHTALNVTITQIYKANGVDKIVDAEIEKIKQKVPDYIKQPLNTVSPVIDVIIKQRVEWTYVF